MANIAFDNSYSRLPPRFYSRQEPVPVSQPEAIRVNGSLASLLGIDPDWLASEQGTHVLAGNEVPKGADPIAQVYAGHQFGVYNPQLGDGRALLLGEVIGEDGERYDIQLKGAGRTRYSRGGDGRAPVGPVLREYVLCEAMHALGIPTTRALAAVRTGEPVYREHRLPGAVLARVARSHIRIGTFEYFAARGDIEALHQLAEHVIERHYPDAAQARHPALEVLRRVIARQARLVAGWQALGFIHGVMNTDNMLLSGETIDYGPCAFMDGYDSRKVYSSIDHGGRYAFANQPAIAHWNLACLAQVLLPLVDEEREKARAMAQETVDAFPGIYRQEFAKNLRHKLGFSDRQDGDQALIDDLFGLMQEHETDFTLVFRRLSDLACPGRTQSASVEALFEFPAAFEPWLERWRLRIESDAGDDLEDAGDRQAAMYACNPAYIPRNHLVEEVIDAAVEKEDFGPFHRLVDVLATPFAYHSDNRRYATPPRPGQVVRQTFCGT